MPALLDLVTQTLRSTGVATIAVVVVSYVWLFRWQLAKAHPDEPPVIPSAIPFAGHLLGMAFQGGRYIKNLGLGHPEKPIFTLPIPRSRMYIITDPSLAAAAQRASKTLSFNVLVPDLTKHTLGLDDATVDIVRQGIDPGPGEPRGFISDMHDMVYAYLGPGEQLNELSLDAARELGRQVGEYAERLGREKGGEETVDLVEWIRHFVVAASANFLYGEQNPLALNPELEDAFWEFDHGLVRLLSGVFPSIIARKAYRGREALVAALEDYLVNDQHLPSKGRKGAAPIIHKRISIALQHGWTLRAAARSELSFLFAAIVNTATVSFWMVLHLFTSTPDILTTIRSEISAGITAHPETGNPTLSLDKLKTSSPALQSLLRECLRHKSDANTTRLVKRPTTLPNLAGGAPYKLVQGAIVQIAGGTMHADARIWGPDVLEFKGLRLYSGSVASNGQQRRRPSQQKRHGTPERWDGAAQGDGVNDQILAGPPPPPPPSLANDAQTMMTTYGTNTTRNNTITTTAETTTPTPISTKIEETRPGPAVHPASFRAFGGGKTLCPGRHFAFSEVLAFAALLVTHFDFLPPADSGKDRKKIRVPPKQDGVLPVHVLEPKGRVVVRVKVRKQSEGVVREAKGVEVVG
ncbi:hypothetical protein VTI74DRAFT_5097 [Chaetomium olivicolor]